MAATSPLATEADQPIRDDLFHQVVVDVVQVRGQDRIALQHAEERVKLDEERSVVQLAQKEGNLTVQQLQFRPSASGWSRLGRPASEALHAYRRSSSRGKRYQTLFCLTPRGVRVGYASPKLLALAFRSKRAHLKGRVVWISTSSEHYAIRGIRPGASLTATKKALRKGNLFHVGKNYWYLVRWGEGTAIFKERGGVVEEIGIAQASVTGSKKADRTFLTSFS